MEGNSSTIIIRNDKGVRVYVELKKSFSRLVNYHLCILTSDKSNEELKFDRETGVVLCIQGTESNAFALKLDEVDMQLKELRKMVLQKSIERIVFYREKAAGMFSALSYTFGQAERLSRVRHSNFVKLMGICSESRFLDYEFLENVNLEDHLACRKKSCPLHWQHRIRIIVDICSALIFVHANDPCTIHRNLRPTNILLNAKFVRKISDFGVHLLISQNENSNYNDLEAFIYMDLEFVE
ncbi:U-box domain-containing protein 32 [Capsicum chinense]|nr:U-box domain-containing protein 32 [Capsicum chinense]